MRLATPTLLVLLLLGCSCDGDPAPTSAVPPPTSAPAPSVVLPAQPPTTQAATPNRAEARPPTAEEARAQLQLLREARDAVRAHDTSTALARFDSLLHQNPRAPRTLCEAGYVSHLAGREEQAASRIDLALRLFGHDADVTPELRVPLAMCLYNRGLVAEAQHDAPTAAASYQRSLALRPNATVSAHLAQLEQAGGPADDSDSDGRLGGTSVRVGEASAFLSATDEAALVAALARGYAGEDWDGNPTEALVTVGTRVPLESGTYTEAILLHADDTGAMLANTSFFIALRQSTGYRVATVSIGSYDSTDHGHSGGCDAAGGELAVIEGVLRLTYDVGCDETCMDEVPPPADRDDVSCYGTQDEGETRESNVVLCLLEGPEPECAHFATGLEQTRAPSWEVRCEDDDGEEVEMPDAGTPPVAAASIAAYAYALDVLAAHRVRVTWSSAPGTPPPGEHSFAEMLGWTGSSDPVVSPSLLFDDARADAEGDEGEGEGDEQEYGEETAE